MFSPAAKKSSYRSSTSSRSKTPLASAINHSPLSPPVATPAPRLSVLARIPPGNKNEKGDSVEPVYVGEFPQVVRDEQNSVFLQKRAPPGEACFSGGMDKETWLAWFICGSRLFVWSYLSPADARKCVVLDLPPASYENEHGDWLVYIVSWDSSGRSTGRFLHKCNSAALILCNRKTRALIYWQDIYSQDKASPVTSLASTEELELILLPDEGKTTLSKLRQHSKLGSNLSRLNSFNSLIASAVHKDQHVCIALACSSSGELWRFHCSPSGIHRERVCQEILSKAVQGCDGSQFAGSKGYPRSLVWHFPSLSSDDLNRQFLFLTDHEIQCFSIRLSHDFNVSKLWTHEIVGTDADLGIQKDLAGQKRIWPLDLQVDGHGKVITILIAIFCKDRITSSSYTEYSLLTMQYKSGVKVSLEYSTPRSEKILEKKAPIQVIIPKARVEDEEFLFSMTLKVGGKPAGSIMILSGDGTATVSHCWRGSTRLYQFDLPYDAGKVLDASVFPSDDGEDGAWAVLTEKAGIWAIPERAVLLGGVEPPERSLSRKGSSNERSSVEERRNLSFASNIAPRRVSSETRDSGDRPRGELAGVTRRGAQDEESEALLSQLFHDFLLSGQVNGVCDKLKSSGAFDKDGETNIFARTSKSIVDTLAKHWTTTRGAEIVALSIVSSQLMEKQQKHQKYLQFLALCKCHEELSSRQRESLHIIMEHGEKLACMIQLRELQNMISQNRSTVVGSSYSSLETRISGAFWDLVQLVGERARRNTVLLMDRDNAEVFYSKVSDLQEVFFNLERQLECIISRDMPFAVQFQRVCELSNACVTVIRTAMHYRTENHLWYPPLEGLTPWFCRSVVRGGLWTIASFMVQLLSEMHGLDNTAKLDFHLNLEVLCEVLLEAYSGAITAKIERGEEHKSLLDDYWTKRDLLVGSLYHQVKDLLAQAKLQDSNGEKEGQYEEMFQKLSSSLLSIATRHEAYQTIWDIWCDINDFEFLRNLMHHSMGSKGGFSYFVFKQLHSKRQFSMLMRLGEEFQEELTTFLNQHQDLLWLHEVFLCRFSAASETLHALALSQNQSLDFVNEETSSFAKNKITLAERRRFLKLSKIAALAGRDADYDAKVRRIDADLKILELQENIFELVHDVKDLEHFGQQLLPPVDLIEFCLKSQNRELSLRAFDVFAWTSCSFLKRNISLLEECWRNAANQDDWEQLYQRSIAEGWGEEETLCHLRETVLFQASERCYGPEAETFEGGFDEVLPLRHGNSELLSMKDTVSSVEAILMQHKDFPDAGKLMLTAVMLGSMQVGARKDVPSPME